MCHVIPSYFCCQSTTNYNLLTHVNIALGNFKNISNNLDIYGKVVGIMANNFYDLKSALSLEAQSKMSQKTEQLLQQLPLFKLRQARGFSQKMMREALHIQQPAVAKIEKRTDMYLSNLRSHIQAMGGELEIVARFPEGSVKIQSFSDL